MKEKFLKYSMRIEEKVSEYAVIRCGLSHVSIAFFYGIFLFLYELKFFRDIISPLHVLLIGWALLIMAYDVLIRRVWIKIPYWQILMLFIVLVGITSCLNFETGIVYNAKVFVMMLIPLGIFYPQCILKEKNERKKAVVISMLGASVIAFVASSIALVMFFKRYSEVITFMGIENLVGIRHYIENDPTSATLLYGLYADTNHAAIYALVFAMFSVFILLGHKNVVCLNRKNEVILKIYASINLVVQVCYFPLANSRGGWLCLFVAGVMALFLYFSCVKFRNKKGLKRFLVSGVMAVGCLVMICFGMLGLRAGMSKISIYQNMKPIESVTEEQVTEPEAVQDQGSVDNGGEETVTHEVAPESFVKTDDGSGSGRLVIWKDALELFKKKPVFGTGAGNNQYYAVKYEMDSYKLTTGAALHNSYLDLLVDYGVLGMVAMLAFLICNVAIVLKIVFNSGMDDAGYYCIGFSVLLIAGAATLLSCLFISTTAMYFLLLIMLGYLVSFSDKEINK